MIDKNRNSRAIELVVGVHRRKSSIWHELEHKLAIARRHQRLA